MFRIYSDRLFNLSLSHHATFMYNNMLVPIFAKRQMRRWVSLLYSSAKYRAPR